VVSVPHDTKIANPVENMPIHGGVIATIVDTSSAMALRTTFDDPKKIGGLTTTDLDVSYVRPATDDVYAEAEVVRAGNSVGVTRVTVESTSPDGDKKEVAVGKTTYRLF
ncbi:MAG: PaaI family thioesterase, partial [Halobacteria archaeon]|nr:PaaI family thioesterase [Halobacteria archaeon]